MSNYFYYKDDLGDHYLPANLNATFTNCIMYGSLENELDRDQRIESEFNYTFDHCYMKLADTVNITNSHFISVIKAQVNDQVFVDPFNKDDYHLSAESPCIDAGVPNGINSDLDGKSRTGNPDIGCYEFQ